MNSTNQQTQKKNETQIKTKKILKAILIVVFICGGCYLSTNYLLPFFMRTFICKIYDVEKTPSPNGKYEAVTFTRDCGGAASAFTPYVSILKSGKKLHRYQVGNVFIGGSGEHFVKAKWITDTHLVIWYKIGKDSLNRDILPKLMVTEKYGILIEYIISDSQP